MEISILFEGEEKHRIEIPENTKRINFDENFMPKTIEFFEDCTEALREIQSVYVPKA